MKKKTLLIIGAVAIAATMVFTATLGLSNNAKMSALTLANIEALARGEAVVECDAQCFTGASCWEVDDGRCRWTGITTSICYGPC